MKGQAADVNESEVGFAEDRDELESIWGPLRFGLSDWLI